MADNEKKYDEGHYTKLMECSDKKDMTEWNEFKKTLYNRNERAHLEGATLNGAYLKGANLVGAHLEGANLFKSDLEGADLATAHLEGTALFGANLEGASLYKAHLEGADLLGARLMGARFAKAHLEGADLLDARLEGASFHEAHLEGADLTGAHLEGANLNGAYLEGAELFAAHLEAARFYGAHLEGTTFRNAICDGLTLVYECSIGWHKDSEGDERLTDFRGVGLDNIRFSPGLKQLLEYSNRKLNWEESYGRQFILVSLLVELFWMLSDYGRSTKRIVSWFLGLSVGFAVLYFFADQLTTGLHATGDPLQFIQGWPLFWRSIYFSIVTMTTLGFGDIHAEPYGNWGHIALSIQVIVGYVLLGALVTRLSILFNSDGPSAKFRNKEKTGYIAKLKKRLEKKSDGDQEPSGE